MDSEGIPMEVLDEVLSVVETGSRPTGGSVSGTFGLPSLGGENLRLDGTLDLQAVRRIPDDYFSSMRTGHLKPSDVLINKDGAQTGKIARYRGEFPEAAINEHLFLLRGTSSICQDYLFRVLLSEDAQRTIRTLITGSAQPGLSRSFLKATWIPLPSFEEQRRIAEILDTIDETIQATERVIAKLRRQREGLEAWLLREGQDAKHVALTEVASVDRGKFSARPRNDPALYGGKYPFIQTGDVTRAQRRTGIGYAQTLNDLGLAVSRKFQVGTIAVTIAANIADTAILDRPMCFPDSVVGVTVFRPNSTRWIELCIHAAKPILEARAPQSAQKNINLQDLRPLIIPVLDPARQHVLAEAWEEQLRLVDREMLSVAKLNQLRSGLAADLLSGRVRTVAA